MFYRRKIILALLELSGGTLDKISLQKLLFLFTQKQSTKSYDFIPYFYGCYSYSASADLKAMVGKRLLIETETHYGRTGRTSHVKMLKDEDLAHLKQIRNEFGMMDANSLMRHTYINYPYWAINSTKARTILDDREFQIIESSKPHSSDTVLFTIGYEGISLEEYLNRLIRNDVKVLVDVRNNPLSMKYGFSKGQLRRYCESLGILYVHLPEVGIQSEQRQGLNSQADYDKLFAGYRQNNLTRTVTTQLKILKLLEEKKRIALTCFEADICQCHRSHLAYAIEHLPGFRYEVHHI